MTGLSLEPGIPGAALAAALLMGPAVCAAQMVKIADPADLADLSLEELGA